MAILGLRGKLVLLIALDLASSFIVGGLGLSLGHFPFEDRLSAWTAPLLIATGAGLLGAAWAVAWRIRRNTVGPDARHPGASDPPGFVPAATRDAADRPQV